MVHLSENLCDLKYENQLWLLISPVLGMHLHHVFYLLHFRYLQWIGNKKNNMIYTFMENFSLDLLRKSRQREVKGRMAVCRPVRWSW